MASIAKRDNGKWRARYRDERGKEHARHFDRRVDAKAWLDRVTASVVRGDYVDPGAGRITFEQWYDEWSARKVWAGGTVLSARQAADSVTFATVPMSKIRASHLEQWVKAMTLPAESRKSGLAPSTISTRFNYVQMAFQAAVRDRVIQHNPCASVVLPSARRQEAAMVLPEAAEVAKVLRLLEGRPFGTFVALCAFAGLRLGEAAGLQVGDVDFLRRTLSVSRQVQGQTVATTEIVPPKHGSERVVHIPAELADLVAAHVSRLGAWGDEQWLFGSAADVRLNRNSAGNLWRGVRGRAGLSADLTLHDLRHWFASGLIAAGCDVVTVQKALGHSSADITLKVYAHLWPTAADKTRTAATAMMRGVLADPERTEAVE